MTPDTSPAKHLFRESALKNNHAIDEIEKSLKVVSISSWIWLTLFIFSLLSMLIWGLLGQVAMEVSASGIILPAEQFIMAENFASENLNDRMKRVASLKDLLNKKQALYKKHYLTITELEQAKQEYFSAKQALANKPNENYAALIKPLNSAQNIHQNQELYTLAFVNPMEGKKILVGMNAYVLPTTMSSYEYGYIKGKIVSVSEYPASKESVYSYLGNMNLVDEFFINGSPFMVKIKLESNYKMPTGLSWTSKQGAAIRIEPGTMVRVKIVYKVCSPFELLTKKIVDITV